MSRLDAILAFVGGLCGSLIANLLMSPVPPWDRWPFR